MDPDYFGVYSRFVPTFLILLAIFVAPNVLRGRYTINSERETV